MEDEIKVGEYIRNIWGDIYKYDYVGHPMFLGDEFYNRIVKHSFNIIDLIEEGDYVNGKEVIEVFGDSVLILSYIETEVDNIEQLYINQIKTIVTKEQIKQIEYRIKE